MASAQVLSRPTPFCRRDMLLSTKWTNSQMKVNRYCILLILLLFGSFWKAGAQKAPFFEPIRPSRAFQVMAHRGASGQTPENSRLALQRAIEDGFEWAEIDLQLTRDGKHVLYHDSKLDGKTDGAGRVADFSLADLKKLDAGSWFAPRFAGERLLSLQETFEIARNKINLYLDCKAINPRSEIDLQLTRDGKHVLYHDSKLDGKTDGAGRVADYSLADLKKLDAGSWFAPRFAGERLLSLQETFEIARNKINLYLDCKAINPESLVREILESGMEQQVVVFDSYETLLRIRQLSEGRVPVMAKWHPADGFGEWLNRLQPAAVEIDANELTLEIGRAFHGKGIKVQAKTLGKEWDRPEMWDRVVASGADWIQTDYAEELIAREVLRRVPRRPIRISHHRGANRYAPENTLPAFEKSIRMGADFVEFDVRTTRDGRFFLLHDGDLRRTTNRVGAIRDVSSDVVTGLDAGSWLGRPFASVRPPTLEEFLYAVAGKVDLYFDAKDIAPEALVAALEKPRVSARTDVYQGVKYLQKLRALNPRVRL